MQPGFTIVELLIVIVVIGVLAGLTVTGYTGIQERSKNATRIQAANQLAKAMYSVASADGGLGIASGRFCLSDQVPDINNDGVKDCGEVDNPAKPATYNQALIDKLKLYTKTLPQGEPVTTWSPNVFYGPIMEYYPGWRLEGTYQPTLLEYWLEGPNQKCTVGKTIRFVDESATSPLNAQGYAIRDLIFSPDPWSYTDSKVTYCWAHLDIN